MPADCMKTPKATRMMLGSGKTSAIAAFRHLLLTLRRQIRVQGARSEWRRRSAGAEPQPEVRDGAGRSDIARRPAAVVHDILGEPTQGRSARGYRRRAARHKRSLRALPTEPRRTGSVAARCRPRRRAGTSGNEAANGAKESKDIDQAATHPPPQRVAAFGAARQTGPFAPSLPASRWFGSD